MGAEPVYVVELELDYCALQFGQLPCTAQADPAQSCYNTIATCPVREVYQNAPKRWRFVEPRAGLFFEAFPFLTGAPSFSPAELDTGGGLGLRSQVTVTLADSAHNDIDVDPYVRQRPFNAEDKGTFWGKFLERNPFYLGRKMTVYVAHQVNGEINLDRAQRLQYVIERIDGPDSSGQVRIVAKDVLKLADNLRAQFPEPSLGRLLEPMDDSQTTFFILPDAAASYPSQGKVRIGSEIIRYFRIGNEFTVVNPDNQQSPVGRGIDNTTAESHNVDATVQRVREVAPNTVPAILGFLLGDIAGIDTAFFDLPQWQSVQPQIGFLFSAQVSEPEGVADLIEQLLRASGAYIWYDERDQKIKLGAIRETPDLGEVPQLNDDANLIEDSISIRRLDDSRLTQVWYSRGLIDSTESITDPINYATRTVAADFESESTLFYRQRRIEQIWARWTPRENAAAAFTVANRRLARYRRTPRQIEFRMDTKDAGIWYGDIVAIAHRNMQDSFGDTPPVPFIITRVAHQGHAALVYRGVEYDVRDVPTFADDDLIIIDSDAVDVNLRDIYEQTIGPAEDAGDVITVVVFDGVRVQGAPAIRTGGFPNSDVLIINRGAIGGRPGRAGTGGLAVVDPEAPFSGNGEPGGLGANAIELDDDTEIRNEGRILAGAGGSGGGAGIADTDDGISGSGAGGSEALLGSSGGPRGDLEGPGLPGNSGQPGSDDNPGQGGAQVSSPGKNNGAGGNGVGYGQPGNPGGNSLGDGSGATGGAPGQPGKAIVTNGFDLDLDDDGEIIGDVD